jgi:YidC/Oxa1 family membrane protein insertase
MINFLSQGLLGFIFWLNNFFNNLGLVIIAFAVILKIIFFPFDFFAFLEEKKIRKLRPQINEIIKKYKTDFIKQAEELNELYKKEKYNPFLSIFFQFLPLPIFLSVFITLKQLLRINDINVFFLNIDLTKNNLFLAFSVIILQLFFIFLMEKEQRKASLFFFAIAIIFLIKLPAIFTLYWLVNLIITLIEKPIFAILEKITSNQS